MHYRQGHLLDRGQEGLLVTERRPLHGYIQSLFGGGAYRQDLGGRRELCVRHPWHKQASTSADVLLRWVFLCEMCRGMVGE